MDVGGSKGGVKSDINVTPLVDVMLVLLIIMMLVAPMLNQGVNVTLPLAQNSSEKPETDDQTVVAIAPNGSVFLKAQPVAEGQLASKINELLETKLQKIVVIKADEEAKYSAVMQVMDELRQAGIEDVGLITRRNNPNAGGGAGGGQ
jgi:biopolymer transport protein ExbD